MDYVRMLYISYGSVCELETQILLAGDLGFIEKGELGTLKEGIAEIERMLKALIKSLENKPSNPWPRPINLTGFSINCQHCEAWSII